MNFPKKSRIRFLRKLFGMILILILLLVLGGCSKTPDQGRPGGAAPAIITIWHTLEGAEAEVLARQAKRISDGNPGIIVKLKNIPETEFVNTTYNAQAGGVGPEILISRKEIIHQLYSKGTIAPVLASSESFPAATSLFKFGEKYYAQPWLTDVPMLFYRKDQVPPPNLSELMSDKTKGILAIPTADSYLLGSLWSGQGGRLMYNGAPVLNESFNLMFLEQIKTWREAGTLQIRADALNSFEKGEIQYFIGWASYANRFSKLNLQWASFPVWGLTLGNGKPLLGSTIAIANSAIKTEPSIQAAIKVVEESLLATEVQAEMSTAGSRLPVNTSYYRKQEAQQGHLLLVSQTLNKAWILEGNSPELKLLPIQDSAWGSVINSGVPPQQALENAQGQALKALGR